MTKRKQEIADLALAASVPQVPFWATLVAQLPMYGFRIVPQDTWPRLMAAIAKSVGVASEELESDEPEEDECDGTGEFGEALEEVGFTEHENHVRGSEHDYWHANELGVEEKKAAAERGVPVWAIPYDEFEAIAIEEDLEGVSITRYLFVGTEQELRDALGRAFPG